MLEKTLAVIRTAPPPTPACGPVRTQHPTHEASLPQKSTPHTAPTRCGGQHHAHTTKGPPAVPTAPTNHQNLVGTDQVGGESKHREVRGGTVVLLQDPQRQVVTAETTPRAGNTSSITRAPQLCTANKSKWPTAASKLSPYSPPPPPCTLTAPAADAPPAASVHGHTWQSHPARAGRGAPPPK